jgi:hypothetical protein
MNEPTWDGERWSDDNPVTDEEKHAYCQRRWSTTAVFLTPSQYAAAERAGADMRPYVINKPMPISPGTVFTIEHKLPSSAEMRAAIQRQIDNGEPLGASHVMEFPLGHAFVNGSIEKDNPYMAIDFGKTEARVIAHMISGEPGVHVTNVAHPETTTTVISKSPFAPSDKPSWGGCCPPRKHVSEKTCNGKDVACLPGRNGSCVACFEED